MKNKKLALKALAQDCTIKGRYVYGRHTCAIGCLALLAGIPRNFFQSNKCNREAIYEGELKPVAMAIKRKFGLLMDQQIAIQEANDEHNFDTEARRAAVMNVVKSL